MNVGHFLGCIKSLATNVALCLGGEVAEAEGLKRAGLVRGVAWGQTHARLRLHSCLVIASISLRYHRISVGYVNRHVVRLEQRRQVDVAGLQA